MSDPRNDVWTGSRGDDGRPIGFDAPMLADVPRHPEFDGVPILVGDWIRIEGHFAREGKVKEIRYVASSHAMWITMDTLDGVVLYEQSIVEHRPRKRAKR